jgi:L-asparaginase
VRRVVVFGLGGTIAMTASDTGGVTPALSAHRLVAAVPGLSDAGITVDVEDFRRVPGASLTFTDVADLASAIKACLADADGVVVIQGTDTIEETAYLLDLLHDGPQPIVVTGAMRNPTMAGADGPGNILAAIQVAASRAMRGQGCLVVFGDDIHAARRVRKTHTTSCATFHSANGGPLGYLVEGQPQLVNQLTYRTPVPTRPRDDVRIALITATLGDDGVLLEGLAQRVSGVVIAGFGAGHVPVRLVPQLQALASERPVVLASRTGAGSVLSDTYSFSGSERDLLERGLIRSGFLDPIKARILLHTLVCAGADTTSIRNAFAVAGGYEEATEWPWATGAEATGVTNA